MNVIRTTAVAGLALLLAACAGSRVATDYDHSARFDALQSFAWQEPVVDEVEDPLLDSGLLGHRLQRSAVAALTERGYEQVADPAAADFLVTYHTTSRERLRDSGGFRLGFGFGGGFHSHHHSLFYSDRLFPAIESYQEGTLIIDVVDADTEELIWRGWTRSTVDPSRYTEEAVDAAVRLILSKFPPGYTPPEE